MGYHVCIINNLDLPNTHKILYNYDLVVSKMIDLGFELETEKGFFYKKNYEFAIFYSDNCLWVSNPDEELLVFLINIAHSFNDGSKVIGDYGEVYDSLSDIYKNNFIYQEQSEPLIKRFLMFFYYRVWFVIPILLAIIKFIM